LPLYLDHLPPEWLPEAHWRALHAAAAQVGEAPVNPATALQLIRGFLTPLVPDTHLHLLTVHGQPSWDRMRIAYADLAVASAGSNVELLAAARFVDLLIRHSANPAREVVFPPHVEVASFARVAKYLGLPFVDPEFVMQGAAARLFSFCRYCWCPAAAHGVCVFHSTRSLPQKTGTALPFCAGSSVKQARRMAASFQNNVNALVTSEELTFHDSDLSGAILLPPSGLRVWLQEHRPSLDRLLGAAMPGERVLGELLGVLYGNNAGAVASAIGGCVYLLTPVSARAEAWIDAWQDRAGWGGQRQGAGRPPESAKSE
jgi:hypothetical protein